MKTLLAYWSDRWVDMLIAPTISSYANTDQFTAHCEAVGHDVAGYIDSDIEQALCRATSYLDGLYGSRFIGEASTFEQPLEWPRKRAKLQGRFLPDSKIPEKIIAAACEAAFMALSGSNDDQWRSIIENLMSGLIQPEQSEQAVFGSVTRG